MYVQDASSVPAVTPEWLQGLWAYLIEAQAVSLFEEKFPLMPILPPNGAPRPLCCSAVQCGAHYPFLPYACLDRSLLTPPRSSP